MQRSRQVAREAPVQQLTRVDDGVVAMGDPGGSQGPLAAANNGHIYLVWVDTSTVYGQPVHQDHRAGRTKRIRHGEEDDGRVCCFLDNRCVLITARLSHRFSYIPLY